MAQPTVIVSSDAYHRDRIDVVVMAVTSQALRSTRTAGEVPIRLWQQAGLPKPSLIKPVLATLDRSLILRRLGELQEEDLQALRAALQQILG